MFTKKINYKTIAYSITKQFLDKINAEFYLYWEDKINNIDISQLPLVDKVFVIMCQEQNLGMTHFELKNEYQINISEDNVCDILCKCQCYDIEITVMAKSFLFYQLHNIGDLEEQIYHITKNGEIDLPFEFIKS